jgi:hypothetical protein
MAALPTAFTHAIFILSWGQRPREAGAIPRADRRKPPSDATDWTLRARLRQDRTAPPSADKTDEFHRRPKARDGVCFWAQSGHPLRPSDVRYWGLNEPGLGRVRGSAFDPNETSRRRYCAPGATHCTGSDNPIAAGKTTLSMNFRLPPGIESAATEKAKSRFGTT